jgi:hypothetical protein
MKDNLKSLAKFILDWWHRLSSLCEYTLKLGPALMTLSFFKIIFTYNIRTISIKFNPFSAQAGKPVPPDSLRGLMESRWKKTFARGSHGSRIFFPGISG